MDKFMKNLLDTLFLFGGVSLIVSSGIVSLSVEGLTATLIFMLLGFVFLCIYNSIKGD